MAAAVVCDSAERLTIQPAAYAGDRGFIVLSYDVIALMIETGFRAGETLVLRWKDVHISQHRLKVHATVVNLANRRQSFVQDSAKSISSNRTIPLTPRAVEILMPLYEDRFNEWVFNNGNERLTSVCRMRHSGIKPSVHAAKQEFLFAANMFFAIRSRQTVITKA